MRLGKGVLGIAAFALLFGGTAAAQIAANRLCILNGGEYYINSPFYGFPNHSAGKYFPSYAHRASTPVDQGGGVYIYPWKLAGWCWAGLQGKIRVIPGTGKPACIIRRTVPTVLE